MGCFRAGWSAGLLVVIACGMPGCGGGGGGGGSGEGSRGNAESAAITGFAIVNAATQFSLPITIAGSPDGAWLRWEIQDGATRTVEGAQQVGASAMPVYGVDVSQLADGPLTLVAELTDVTGDVSQLPVLTGLKDTQGPAAVMLALPGSTIDAANEAAFSLSFSLADPADTGGEWFLTARDALGLELSFSGAVGGTTVPVGPLDLASLNAGPVTLRVSLSDALGNVGGEANVTLTKLSVASQPTRSRHCAD